MKIFTLFFLTLLYFSNHSLAGSFCLCSDDNTRGSREPLNCNDECRSGCVKQHDSSSEDYKVKGCGSGASRIKLCDYGNQCISEMYISATGYADGHKGWWCRSVGFDDAGKDRLGNDICVRDCNGPNDYVDAHGCEKIAMGCLGYKEGHKQKFCGKKGYPHSWIHPDTRVDGWDKLTHGSANVLEPGICYKGNPEVCAWKVEPSTNRGPGPSMRDIIVK